MQINFFSEDITFQLKQKVALRQWIDRVIKNESFETGTINYIFCSDDYLLKINQDYLQHDTYTDIITFDNSDEEDVIEGDIFISITRVKENAKQLNIPFEKELHRVLVHGILHLCGYHDKSTDEKEGMRKKEDACLSLLLK